MNDENKKKVEKKSNKMVADETKLLNTQNR